MKIYLKKIKRRCAYTLIELSVVIVLILLIATTLTSMLAQQVQFYSWWQTQKFIAEDAPLVNSMIVRLLSRADGQELYDDRTAALAGGNGTLANASAVNISFAQPDGSVVMTMLEYDGTDDEILFHVLNDAQTGIISTWTVASGVADADFSYVNDTFQFTLTGPYGGQVTYASTPTL